MLDVFILSILVGVNILIDLFFKYKESQKSPPLSSREFHFFRYDDLEKFKEILNESDTETRLQLFEELQKIKKHIRNSNSDSN
jgi:hypothetical protein